jgi:hypothetical protein
MRPYERPAVLLLCAALVGCTDRGITSPAGDDAIERSQAATFRGATIDRSSFVGTVFGGGPPQNLAVSVGNATVCPFSPGSPAPLMIVQTPSGKIPTHAVTREANVQVFEFSAGIVTDACDLLDAPLVATGTVFFTHIATFEPPGTAPGSFRIHVTVHGIVDLVEGGQARLQAIANFVIRPDGTLVKDQEPVTLKPI